MGAVLSSALVPRPAVVPLTPPASPKGVPHHDHQHCQKQQPPTATRTGDQNQSPSLMSLPTELHLLVSSHLTYPDALSLKHVNRHFYHLVDTGVSLKVAWLMERRLLHLECPNDRRCDLGSDLKFCRGSVRLLMRRRREHFECESRPGLGCLVLGTVACEHRRRRRAQEEEERALRRRRRLRSWGLLFSLFFCPFFFPLPPPPAVFADRRSFGSLLRRDVPWGLESWNVVFAAVVVPLVLAFLACAVLGVVVV